MSVNLCIDYGNTNVKTAIFDSNNLVETHVYTPDDVQPAVSSLIEKYKPSKAVFCSVVNRSDTLEKILKEQVKGFLKIDGNTRTPVMNAYQGADTLGADRLALAVAAQHEHPDQNMLVISLGTCITYNFIQKNKTFRGGAISPGLQMRLKAMHEFTGKLPEVNLDGDLLLLGYDTPTCMRSGAVFGMAAEIDGIIKEYNSQYTEFNAVLTGGDAPYFAAKIKSKIFADPHLLLKGLNLILNYNVLVPR